MNIALFSYTQQLRLLEDIDVKKFFLQLPYPIGLRLKQIGFKEVDKGHMNRLVITTILKLCAEAIFFTIIAGIIIGVIGYKNKWGTSLLYSNAFFIAGCIMIIAGASTRLGAGQSRNSFQMVYAESFRHMSNSERANFVIDASSSLKLVILGLLSGILLILISVLVTKLF